jgi:hypothetical protein
LFAPGGEFKALWEVDFIVFVIAQEAGRFIAFARQ